MGFGLVEVMGVGEKERCEAEASADIDHGKERGITLTEGFEAFYCAGEVTAVLGVVGEGPEAFRHQFHHKRKGSRLQWMWSGLGGGARRARFGVG